MERKYLLSANKMKDRTQQWESLANSLSNYIPKGVEDIHDQKHVAARNF